MSVWKCYLLLGMRAKTRSSTPTEQIRYTEKKSFPTHNSWHLGIQEVHLGFAFSNGWWFEPRTYYDRTEISEFSAMQHPSTLKGEKGQPFDSSALLSIALDYCLQFLTLIKILLSLFQPFDSNSISQHFTFSVQVHSQNHFFSGKKKFLCQFQAIIHCLLEILLVFETCQKTFYSVSLQHTSLKDLVGFNIPLAAVVFKFIFNIMSCLRRNAN